MQHFALAHFNAGSGGDLPAEADVRIGVAYGDGMTGTAVSFAAPLTDLESLNLSQFDESARVALDSMYRRAGYWADYNGSRVRVMLEDQREALVSEGGQRMLMEYLTVLIRRYDGVARPQKGDELLLGNSAGIRRYRLTEDPVDASDHLEFRLEFGRAVTRFRGGTGVVTVA